MTRGEWNQPEIWHEFLQDDRYRLYVHCKNPGSIQDELMKKHIIQKHHEHTKWGHISLVKVMVSLLSEAYQDENNQRFVIVSESCIPIRNSNFIYNKMMSINKSWIRLKPKNNFMKDRFHMVDNIARTEFEKCDQWVGLTRNHTKTILSFNRVQDFRRMFAADEHYIPTCLRIKHGNDLEDQLTGIKSTWVDFSQGNPRPRTYESLSLEMTKTLIECKNLFARKFSVNAKVKDALKLIHSKHS